MLRERVTIMNKVATASFGDTTQYEDRGSVWASITWTKGVKALQEGALDAYDTVIIRMRWNAVVNRDSLIVHNGKTYQIQSLHVDKQENQIQITATEKV